MISEKAIIAKNAGILVITDVVTRLLGTILTIVIARKLGAASLGLLSFALSFTIPFGFLASFGFKNLISRDIAKEPDKTSIYLGNIFLIKVIFSILTLIIIISILYFTNNSREKSLVVGIAALMMMLNNFIDFSNSFFRAHQKAEYEAVVTIILNILSAGTGLSIVFLGHGLVPLISVRFLVYLLCFIMGFGLVMKKLARPDCKIQLNFCLQIIRSAVPFAILGVITNVNAQMGTILLSYMKGDLVTGWFSAALRLCGVFSFIPIAFVGAVLPAMSRFFQHNLHNKLAKTYEESIKFMTMIILPIAAGITILASKFILLVYGDGFIQSIIILKFLIWVEVFSFLNRISMITFASLNKEKGFLTIQIIGTIIHLGLNIVLIPSMGGIGTSIATIFSQIIIFISASRIISKQLPQAQITKIMVKPTRAVLIMSLFLVIFSHYHLAFLIPIAAVIYTMALIAFKTFNDDELSILKELIKTKIGNLKF